MICLSQKMHIKYVVLVITMLAYMSVHMIRTVVPFTNLYISQYFGLDNRTLGFANSCSYTILGIGYFLQSIYPAKNLKLSYLVYVTLVAISLSLISVYTFIGMQSQIVLFITFACVGLFQWNTWSVVISLLMKYFTPQRDGFAIGIWSTCAQLGNIVGFFICTLFIYQLNFPWQTCLFFVSALTIVFAVALFFLPDSPEQQNLAIENHEKKEYHGLQSIKAILPKLKGFNPIYIYLEMVLLKILVYGVLLWLPLYLQISGLKSFAGIIPISFNIAAMIGASSFGNFYSIFESATKRHIAFFCVSLCIFFTFWVLKFIELGVENQWVLVILLALMGYTLVGKYNMIVSNESFEFVEKNHIDPFIWGSVFESVGCIGIGLFQIVIGLVTYKNEQALFIIFLVVNFVSLALELSYTIFLYRCGEEEQRVRDGQNQSNKLEIQ